MRKWAASFVLLFQACGGGGGIPLAWVTGSDLGYFAIGNPLNVRIEISGGSAPYNWDLLSGFPADQLNWCNGNTGTVCEITGTPTAPGEWTFRVRITDAEGRSVEGSFTIRFIPADEMPSLSIAGGNPEGEADSPFSLTLEVTGGLPPFSYDIASGRLPAGLRLCQGNPTQRNDRQCVIDGTPTEWSPQPFQVTVRVRDSHDPPIERTLDLQITIHPAGGPLALAGSPEAHAIELKPYDSQIQIQGGKPPFTWEIVQGALPSGLTFCTSETGNTCAIAGTPGQEVVVPPPYARDFSYRVRVRDSNNPPQEETWDFTLTVHHAAPAGFHIWYQEAGTESTYSLSPDAPGTNACWGFLTHPDDPQQKVGIYGVAGQGEDLKVSYLILGIPPQPGVHWPEDYFIVSVRVPELQQAQAMRDFQDLYIADFQQALGLLTLKFKGSRTANDQSWSLHVRTRQTPFDPNDVGTPLQDWLNGYQEITLFRNPTLCPDVPFIGA